nr:MFS transporter [candidate division Zixibacteria bacterium]
METKTTAIRENHNHEIMRRWLTILTVEGSLATVFITLTGGAFLTGLALMLGANDFEIGLLAAIPFFAQVAQLFSAYLIDRTGRRKQITIWFSAIARQSWWLLVPILVFGGSWRLEAMIAIVIISNIAIMIATVGWMSWVADLVPDKIRGRYFGTRSAAVALSTIVSTLAGGIILDQYGPIDLENTGFAILIASACVFALAAVILLNRVPDPATRIAPPPVNLSYLFKPLKNKDFRQLTKVFIGWNLAIGIAAPFFAPHMLNYLGMNFTMISLYSAAAAVVAILLNKPWGKLIDRFGCKPVVVFCAFGISAIPLIWLFLNPGNRWILIPEVIYSAILWTGFNLAAFNIPIANSPRGERTIYLAMFALLTGLAFFVASIIGGIIAQSLIDFTWMVGSQRIINYQILFAVSSLLRMAAAGFFTTFHEPKEKRLPVMINFMGYSILKWFSSGRQIFPHPPHLDKSAASKTG